MKALFRHFGRKEDPAVNETAPRPDSAPTPETVINESQAVGVSAPSEIQKRPPVLPERKAPAEMFTLTLGDFLDRIPAKLMEEGAHDRSIPLAFDMGFMCERIWECETQIPLKEIIRRVPDIFRPNAMKEADAVIRFPWNKVLAVIVQARKDGKATGLTPSGLEALALKVKARNLLRSRVRAETSPLPAPPVKAKQDVPAWVHTPSVPPSSAPPPEPVVSEARVPLVPPVEAQTPAPEAQAPAAPPTFAGVPTVELERIEALHQEQIAALAAERDQALAASDQLRNELAWHHKQMTLERRLAAEAHEKLDLLQKDRGGSDPSIDVLKAERDEAVARLTQIESEHQAALARIGDIVAERDAASARAEKLSEEVNAAAARALDQTTGSDATADSVKQLTTERDSALGRVAELTAAAAEVSAGCARELTAGGDAAAESIRQLTIERDAALARVTELAATADAAAALAQELTAERDAAVDSLRQMTTERDAALARLAELTTTADAAAALARELTTERDAAAESLRQLTIERDVVLARVTELTAERDAALARNAEVCTERDAAVACAAEYVKSHHVREGAADAPVPSTLESRTMMTLEADIDGDLAPSQALLEERAVPGKTDEPPAAPATESPDKSGGSNAYATLFPPPSAKPRPAVALAIGCIVVALAILAGFVRNTPKSPPPKRPADAPRLAKPDFRLSTLAAGPTADVSLKLEAPSEEVTMTLLPPGRLLGESAGMSGTAGFSVLSP